MACPTPSCFKCRVTFQKGAQVSALLILRMGPGGVLTPPRHGIKPEPWVKIKPSSLHIKMGYEAKRCDFFPHRAARTPKPAGASELHMCKAAFSHTHTHAHTHTQHTYRSFIFFRHRPFQYAHIHTSTEAKNNGSIHNNTARSQMNLANRLCRGRCSEAETGAIHRASCSLPGNYHIKLVCSMVLTGPRPSHYSLV